jgi:hypothetical protein
MLTRADIQPLSIAAGSAVAAGLAFGLWLALPSYLASPAIPAEPEAVGQIDPNLAQYRQMVAAEGVNTIPYVLVATPRPEAALSEDPDTASEAKFAREEAIYQTQERAAEAQRVAWLQSERTVQRAEVVYSSADQERARDATLGEGDGPTRPVRAEPIGLSDAEGPLIGTATADNPASARAP